MARVRGLLRSFTLSSRVDGNDSIAFGPRSTHVMARSVRPPPVNVAWVFGKYGLICVSACRTASPLKLHCCGRMAKRSITVDKRFIWSLLTKTATRLGRGLTRDFRFRAALSPSRQNAQCRDDEWILTGFGSSHIHANVRHKILTWCAVHVVQPLRRDIDPNARARQHDAAGGSEKSRQDRKSTRLNSSHSQISYAVF